MDRHEKLCSLKLLAQEPVAHRNHDTITIYFFEFILLGWGWPKKVSLGKEGLNSLVDFYFELDLTFHFDINWNNN
jgi:hypothetical protein